MWTCTGCPDFGFLIDFGRLKFEVVSSIPSELSSSWKYSNYYSHNQNWTPLLLLFVQLKELLEFRTKCGILWSYDWVSIPLVYTQVFMMRELKFKKKKRIYCFVFFFFNFFSHYTGSHLVHVLFRHSLYFWPPVHRQREQGYSNWRLLPIVDCASNSLLHGTFKSIRDWTTKTTQNRKLRKLISFFALFFNSPRSLNIWSIRTAKTTKTLIWVTFSTGIQRSSI